MENQRQLDTRLLVTSLILLVLFMLLAALAFLAGRKVERDSALISTDAVPGTIDAHALRLALTQSVGYAMLAGMADGDPAVRGRALEISAGADAGFRDAMEKYRATIHINPERDRELTAALLAEWTEFQRRRAAFVDLLRAGRREEGNAFFVAEVLPAFERASRAAEELLAYNHGNTLAYSGRIAGHIATLRWSLVIVLLLAVICVGILAANLVTRRRQQRAILESERRLRLVLDNLFAYVAVLKPDGTTLEVNHEPLRVADLKREDVIGRRFYELPWWTHSAEAQARVRAAIERARAGQTERYDVEVAVADGSRVTVDFGCGPLRNTEGAVILLVATAVDITARKELEQQFLRAQRMDAIGMLAGGLAHDLNNILAPMLIAANLLKTRVTTPADQRMVAMIERGAQRGADIIRQLLTFGRGEVGAKGPVQVRHLLREMTHIMKETFPRNIEVDSAAPPELWPVEGDATQLHQVLLNLCVNARDAMPRGGKLMLAAENVTVGEDNRRQHAQAAPGRHVLLTATDTGEGIPRDIINRIFDPFFTTKPVGKGTGLGLSSVLGIVKNHGGLVTVDSEPGRGTTFHVYLPVNDVMAATVPAAADDFPRGQGETILMVDDEAAMRDTTRTLLEAHNYRVLVAGDGGEALAIFALHRAEVRLLLSDGDMPVMSGPDLIRAIRVLEPALKVLVMSGSSQAEKREELAALGIEEVLKKPCEPRLLLNRLREELAPDPRP